MESEQIAVISLAAIAAFIFTVCIIYNTCNTMRRKPILQLSKVSEYSNLSSNV